MMKQFLAKRLIWVLPTLWGVVTLVFLLGHALPSDPVEIMLGETAPPAKKAELRHDLGLDRPLFEQYALYMARLCVGDMGRSIRTGRAVASEVQAAFPLTLRLGLTALLMAVAVALPLGGAAARWPGGAIDKGALFVSTAGLSMPSFFLGPILLLAFAVWRPWFPVSGSDEPGAIILPAMTLALPLAGFLTRTVRASMREESQRDYLRAARARGLTETGAFFRHAGPNGLAPVATVIGLQLGAVLTGAVLVEKIFRWPGLGTLVLSAISSRDYPLVQGVILAFAAVAVAANLLADVAVALLDPRAR
jgi:peptide/nickel transport system permease protein